MCCTSQGHKESDTTSRLNSKVGITKDLQMGVPGGLFSGEDWKNSTHMNTQGVAPETQSWQMKGKLHKNNVHVYCCSWKDHIPPRTVDDHYITYRLTTVLCLGQYMSSHLKRMKFPFCYNNNSTYLHFLSGAALHENILS